MSSTSEIVRALVVDLEGVPVVPGSLAHLARHIHVGQEVHLDLDRAVAGAVLAAPALDVEREPARTVPAHLRFGRLREQLADVVEDAGVGGRVRPRCTSDRRLVHADDLVDLLQPGDPGVPTRHQPGTVDLVGQHRVQDVVDERRLARPGQAGDRDELAQREAHGQVAQVVLAGAVHGQFPAGLLRAAHHRQRDHPPAGRGRRPVIDSGFLSRSFTESTVHDVAAVLAGARADIDDPVRGPDGVLVVLDHDQRVAQVLQPYQRLDQPVVVPLVQADAAARRARRARRPDRNRSGWRAGSAAPRRRTACRRAGPATGSRGRRRPGTAAAR